MPDVNHQPMYQRVKKDILNQIENKLLEPGDRLPTEHQLVEQYDVSRITISKALNELKKEGILYSYPGKGTFVADTVPVSSLIREVSVPTRAASSGTMTEIACILPSITDQFSLSLINGVQAAFPDDSYICHIFQSKNPQIENYLFHRCLDSEIAGIILFPQDQPFFSNELLSLQLQNYPLVLVDRYLPRLDTSYVIADNRAAGSLCVRHLHELGHQRLAFVTSSQEDTFSVKHRIAGARDAARDLDMQEQALHIVEHLDQRKKLSFYREQFFDMIVKDRISAFIASESGCCSYLYDLFVSMKLKVPDNVSLLSFDKPASDLQSAGFFTHINQSEYIIGREAGNILRRRLEQRDMNIYHKVILPQLQVCRSTGPSHF